jgi:hypothetical protein
VWEWQFDGQCWIRTVQVTGSGPSSASLPVPAYETGSSTAYVVPSSGEVMLTVGGVLLATVMLRGLLVVVLLLVSRATAVIVWLPFATVVVSRSTL